MVTAVVDLFPDYLRVGHRREILVGLVCLVDMAIGCTMVMQVRVVMAVMVIVSDDDR